MAGSVRRRVAAGVVALLALGAAGCGGGGEGAAGPASTEPTERAETTTTTAPVTTTTALTEEQAVLAAYQGYWDTWLAANDPPDPDHPGLEQYATGSALVAFRDAVANHRSVGQVVRLLPETTDVSRPRVVGIGDGFAQLEDCITDGTALVDAVSGTVLDRSVVTMDLAVDLHLVGGEWRVAVIRERGSWMGVAGCAGS